MSKIATTKTGLNTPVDLNLQFLYALVTPTDSMNKTFPPSPRTIGPAHAFPRHMVLGKGSAVRLGDCHGWDRPQIAHLGAAHQQFGEKVNET